MASPSFSIDKTLDALICADESLGAILAGRKVYSGVADEGAEFPFIVLGNSTEASRTVFKNKGGRETGTTINVYSTDRTNEQVKAIYDILDTLFNLTPILVDGFTFIQGKLSLVDIFPDEPSNGTHLVASYEVITNGPA